MANPYEEKIPAPVPIGPTQVPQEGGNPFSPWAGAWSALKTPTPQWLLDAPGVSHFLRGGEAALGQLERFHEGAVVPVVSDVLQYSPVTWEAPEDMGKWEQVKRFPTDPTVGPKWTSDAFRRPDGGLYFGQVGAEDKYSIARYLAPVFGKELEKTATVKGQRIQEEVERREAAGEKVDWRKRQEIEKDLYKLPPFVRGTLEEVPYIAFPPARAARVGLQAARTGARIQKLGKAAPAARAAIRTGEVALKPLELYEEALAALFTAPFRGAKSLINKRQVNTLTRKVEALSNQKMPELGDTSPEQVLLLANQHFQMATNIPNRFRLVNNRFVQNEEAIIPDTVRVVRPKTSYERQLEQIKAVPEEVRSDIFAVSDIMETILKPGVSPALAVNNLEKVIRRNAGVYSRVALRDLMYNVENAIKGFKNIKRKGISTTQYKNDRNAAFENLKDSVGEMHQGYLELGEVTTKGRVTATPGDVGFAGEAIAPIKKELVPEAEALEYLLSSPLGSSAVTRSHFDIRSGRPLVKGIKEEFLGAIDDPDSPISNAVVGEKLTPEEIAALSPEDIRLKAEERLQDLKDQSIEEIPVKQREELESADDVEAAEVELTTDIDPDNISPGSRESIETHAVMSDPPIKEILDKNENIPGMAERIIRAIRERAPRSADRFQRFLDNIWDEKRQIRTIIDHLAIKGKLREPQMAELFKPGGKYDLLAALHLAQGTMFRPITRYNNFFNDLQKELYAELPDTKEDLVKEVGLYIQAKNWTDIGKVKAKRREGWEPRRLLFDGKKFHTDNTVNKDFRKWIGDTPGEQPTADSMINRLTPEEFEAVVEGAKKVQRLYNVERNRMERTGFLSKERAAEWRRDFQWYNPTVYAEMIDNDAVAMGMANTSNMFSVTDNGFRHLADNLPDYHALDPLDPEVMQRHLIQNELKILKNTTAKMIHALVGEKQTRWIEDVSSRFVDEKGFALPVPHPKIMGDKRGYLSFFENGNRKVFGGVGEDISKDHPAPVPEVVFDVIYGKGGLATMGSYHPENFVGWLAGLRRGTITTFNPVFMVTNGVIDMFTVWLRRGIMPRSVIEQLIKSYPGIVNNSENRLIEIAKAAGYLQSRTTNVQQYSSNLQRQINKYGHDALVLYDTTGSDTSLKIARAMDDIMEKKFLKPLKWVGEKWSRSAQAVEQAARLEVAERVLRQRLGPEEFDKLMDMSPKNFSDQLLVNYQGTGRGLADDPRIREAGMAALESTVNFGRGGTFFRRINPYSYFLNAAMEGTKLPFRAMGINLFPAVRPIQNRTPDDIRLNRFYEWGNFDKEISKGVIPDALPYPRKRGVTATAYEGADITERTTPGGVLSPNLRVTEGLENLINTYAAGTMPIIDSARVKGAKLVTGRGMQASNAAMMRMAGVLSAQASIMGWNLMHADEWGYWEIPGWIKYSGFLIMLPPNRDEDGEVEKDLNGKIKPSYIVVPHRTREWSVLTGPVQFMFEEMSQVFGKTAEGKNDFKLFVKGLIGQSSPSENLPILGELAEYPLSGEPLDIDVATLTKPFPVLREVAEEWQGRDFWREEPIVPTELAHLDPSEQYQPNTSETLRRVAGILPENWTYSSPVRLHHLYDNVLGGTGKAMLSLPDWILATIDGIHRKHIIEDPKTPEEQVNHYRKLDRSSDRRAFRASIWQKGAEEGEKFEAELRMPHRELSSLPVVSDVLRRYVPPYSGRDRELTEKRLREKFPEVDPAQSRDISAHLKRVKKELFKAQQDNDAKLLEWAGREVGDPYVGINPKEWRQNRSDNFTKYDFFKEWLAEIEYPDSIQAMPEEDQDKWYDILYEIAATGGADNMETHVGFLMAGYYSIRYPEGEDPDIEELNRFYDAREKYITGIQKTHAESNPVLWEKFNAERTAHMTDVEKTYDKARKTMGSYFDIGSISDEEFMDILSRQGWSDLWYTYLTSNKEEKNSMSKNPNTSPIIKRIKDERNRRRESYVRESIDAYGSSQLDNLLSWWYGGDYYSGKAITSNAKRLSNKLYGGVDVKIRQFSTPTGTY